MVCAADSLKGHTAPTAVCGKFQGAIGDGQSMVRQHEWAQYQKAARQQR